MPDAGRGIIARIMTDESQPLSSAAEDEDATAISQRAPVASDPTPTAPLTIGDIGNALVGHELGHFRLEEFVGGGGMGTVFRGTDLQLDRTVAVKVLTHRYADTSETVRRFRVEAQSAARLNHENIARVYFVGEDKGWNFIVFEYIDGENLRDLVANRGRLSIAQSVDIVFQIANALDHACDRQVVHRDIKPSNVLLTTTGQAKLVDMGLARLRQVESVDEDLTASGMTLGTFDYISPEQGRDPRDADVRSDLYSLGCTFYYMLAGQPPYPDGTVLQKLLSHTSDPPPDPRMLRADCPDGIADIVLRLLQKNPDDRFQSPLELMAALSRVAEQEDLALATAPNLWPLLAQPTPSPLVRALPWLIPLLLLILVSVSVDWLVPRRGDGPAAAQPPPLSIPDAADAEASAAPTLPAEP